MKLTFNYILAVLTFCATGCQDRSVQTDPKANNDSVSAGMMRAKESGEQLQGRFIDITKITEKTYALKVQISKDSFVVFETLMPLSTTEIDLLKKSGNNLKLTYSTYHNPVTGKEVRTIRYMELIYEAAN